MKIQKYSDYINESKTGDINDILMLPLEGRLEVKEALEDMKDIKKNEKFNESNEFIDSLKEFGGIFKDMFKSILSKLKKWLSKKMIDILINMNEKDLNEKIQKLKQLDPTDLSDIDNIEAIYLGGGIDKTSEEGAAGWRDSIESYFGMDHIIKGKDMIRLAKMGKIDKSQYPKPLILNPLRNELVRNDDPKFAEIFRKWKAGELDSEKDHQEWKYWADVINKEIYAPDLRIVNICDTNLVKLDPAAGAGTISEIQVSSLRGLNIFIWLDNGYSVKDISPWLIPSISKLIRSDEELEILLDKIKEKNAGKTSPSAELSVEKFKYFNK